MHSIELPPETESSDQPQEDPPFPSVMIGKKPIPFGTVVAIEISHEKDKKSLEHGYELVRNAEPPYVLVVKQIDAETADIRTVSEENIIRNNPELFAD